MYTWLSRKINHEIDTVMYKIKHTKLIRQTNLYMPDYHAMRANNLKDLNVKTGTSAFLYGITGKWNVGDRIPCKS